MYSYTVLIMRKDATDKRPMTLHISARLLWVLVVLALTSPFVGFMLSAGWLAPVWLRLNLKNMEQAVEDAEKNLHPLQKQNADLAARKATLEEQLQKARQELAGIETRVTMAETAKQEASTRLAAAETELITLKQSLATYEKLLKPKLDRELVQCVDLNAVAKDGAVRYGSGFAKVVRTAQVPANLVAKVRVLVGDNAVMMEQGKGLVAEHALDVNKSPKLAGELKLPASASGATRLLDLKIYDGSQVVGYCWKAF
ncbi:MAG: hypothetical protein EBQ80_02175 [Proteobacteria bacterium]|nr:hypothetical protein [Pseudomonadota bacterium]